MESLKQHWRYVRESYSHCVTSNVLHEVFASVEDAPLLVVLDDLLQDLDQLLLQYEGKPGSAAEGEEGGGAPKEGVDGQYVALLEMQCLLQQRMNDVQYRWTNVYDTFTALGKTPTNECDNLYAKYAQEHRCRMQPSLSTLIAHVSGVMLSLTSEGQKQPRLFRFATHLKLTDKERKAFNYIFMRNAGVLFSKMHSKFTSPLSATNTTMASDAAAFARLTSREMLEFFDEERLLLKQELLEPEDEFSTITTTSFLKIPHTVLKACCGSVLSAEERYKIDKTAMADVMAEEEEEAMDEVQNREEREHTCNGSDKGGEGELAKGGVEEEDEKTAAVELEAILRSCNEIQQKATEMEGGEMDEGEGASSVRPQPYETDLSYLEDQFQLIETLLKARKSETNEDTLRHDQRKPEAVARELRAKARGLQAKVQRRMEATRKNGAWLPRLERLAELRSLDDFEKNVLLTLTGSMVSRNLRDSTDSYSDAILGRRINIGALIGLFCDGLEEQIHSRVYFYKNSKLVSEGLVQVNDPPLHGRGNFLDSQVELDRRLLDYIVGLDTEINELVDGSDLYTPDVTLGDVALPEDHRKLITSTFLSIEHFQKTCKDLGLNTRGVPQGLCLLFYGPSGTGKTMTANAVASHLGKKVLLVTVSALTERDVTKEMLRFLFREAKIHNAVLFFDECEMLFESRDNHRSVTLALMLTEIEQYSGIIILATNRHQDLDEAMHRRIQLSLGFTVPDYTLRTDIWKSHVPAGIVSGDVDWNELALSHELTGGLIKNAVLSALSLAVQGQEQGERVLLTQQHLVNGAKLQLRGLLEMVDFERRVIPTFGYNDLVLEDSVKEQLSLLLNVGKTSKFISAQWGFGGKSNVAEVDGLVCLLCGKPGTGKTAVAHAIAFELGQPVKEANCTELLAHTFTSQSRGSSRGVAAFFRDAQRANAVVVLDGVELLLASVSVSSASGVIGCEGYTLLYQVERFPGVVILTSRMGSNYLDLSRLPYLRYILDLPVPRCELRAELWKKLLPQQVPVAGSIDFMELGKRYELTGGEIAKVLCSAAEEVATETTGPTQLTQGHLMRAAEAVISQREQFFDHQLSIFR